ncbi:hypothetical protein H257_03884 [Aphanomyces astaci]|uniref:PX domain-containing protein n=2 Tax=Aphanomyces astaci TaxID=112090 RepID=W4GYP8_APHAT|nr:hypothetical protein H257_03884 [Aphanomyces astaci]ETV84792.1 hypothetical protein H257_03884 [Aphanomyces astaci]RQM25016.1 hypothetical protein B5M09_003201 [Aphanomyces astaci]|eukprot:XP_009826484.1 hypothetical protein H257_03884 [Aphanomyces astaci]
MIYVGDAGRVGDGVNGHHVYPVRCSLFGPSITEVDRRYSDFAWLHAQLAKTCPGCILPPIPGKVVGILHSREFLEARRIGLQKFLTNVAAHEVLMHAPSFRQFLQASTVDLSALKAKAKVVNDPKQALTNWFGKAVQKFSEHDKVQSLAARATGRDVVAKPKSDQDLAFDQIAGYVTMLDGHAKLLQQKVLAAYRANRATSAAYCDVIEATSELAELESSLPEMKSVGFQSVMEIVDIRAKHLDSDWAMLTDAVDDFSRWITSVQAALATREDRRFAYQAQLAAAAKLSGASPEAASESPDKQRSSFSSFLGQSSASHVNAAVQVAKADFEAVHERVMSEVLKFREEKASVLKVMFLQFASLQLDNATEFSETLHRVVPKLKDTSTAPVAAGHVSSVYLSTANDQRSSQYQDFEEVIQSNQTPATKTRKNSSHSLDDNVLPVTPYADVSL